MASAPVHMHAKISACAPDDTHKFRRRKQIKANCAWNARNSTCCIVLALSQCLQRVDSSSLCHLQMQVNQILSDLRVSVFTQSSFPSYWHKQNEIDSMVNLRKSHGEVTCKMHSVSHRTSAMKANDDAPIDTHTRTRLSVRKRAGNFVYFLCADLRHAKEKKITLALEINDSRFAQLNQSKESALMNYSKMDIRSAGQSSNNPSCLPMHVKTSAVFADTGGRRSIHEDLGSVSKMNQRGKGISIDNLFSIWSLPRHSSKCCCSQVSRVKRRGGQSVYDKLQDPRIEEMR